MAPPTLKRPQSTDADVSPPPSKRKLIGTNTTTSKAVANFFTPTSKKAPEKVTFKIAHETLLIARHDEADKDPRPKPVKLAAFDFDSTLIDTKSGLRFARSEDDWKWWHASVPVRLKKLYEEGYALLVVSNQAGISLKSDGKVTTTKRLNNFKGKINTVFKALDLPISLYAATSHDVFRKPRAGMWEQILKDYGLSDAGDIDHAKCIFVGDAAGRQEDKAAKIKKDHSCSDRDFAANVDITFHTPEEFFLGEETKPFVRSFNPKSYLQAEIDAQTDNTPIVFTKKDGVELVLFCGSPGAGKSTFYWTHLAPLGFERVNQDILKTRDKCMKVATQVIEEGKSVVVDNTNADIETRAAWIARAKALGVPVRLVHFTAPAKLCEHNDTVRALSGELMNPESRTMLPKMAFSGFASRYREPTVKEGFGAITRVDFKFRGTEEQKAIWGRYWVS